MTKGVQARRKLRMWNSACEVIDLSIDNKENGTESNFENEKKGD